MKNNVIEISCNDLKKSLPDVAYNSQEDTFFVFWAASRATKAKPRITLLPDRNCPEAGNRWAGRLSW